MPEVNAEFMRDSGARIFSYTSKKDPSAALPVVKVCRMVDFNPYLCGMQPSSLVGQQPRPRSDSCCEIRCKSAVQDAYERVYVIAILPVR
jgi:hypothetical protein